ncbi:MAG: DNA polymerase III subunit delta [Cyanobacteria bacterium]|nr:DNA polymerase III subunit delta [Cyanobacteriota bacterium]MDW8201757.1 DNA polymerase III subunit delta [Cyanobacteriota bacterium SKYGB_h_bin112]
MPIYVYWGEDEYALHRAVKELRDRTLDPAWASFNDDKFFPEQADAIIQALNQAMTPPFGSGGRFIWLVNTPLLQQCPPEVLTELERTLPQIPDHTVLLLTSSSKPDARLKSTKLLQRYAQIEEFSPIPSWKTEQLVQRVKQVAMSMGINLTSDSTEFIAEAIGNDTRRLYSELEKLQCFAGECQAPLELDVVSQLITVTTQTSFKLAAAIRQGNTAEALELVADLLARNEAPPAIVATLISQFRAWLWVKLLISTGERDDRVIAQAADVGNPKRVHFLQQEVKSLSLEQLRQGLPLLLALDVGLKQGANPDLALKTTIIELCHCLRSH